MKCPHCQNEHSRMIEKLKEFSDVIIYYCVVCGKRFTTKKKSDDK